MKGQTTECRTCMKPFVKKLLTQVYCSSECSYVYMVERQKNKALYRKFTIFERDGFKCFYCGKSSIENDARLVLDHVVPISSGGSDAIENLVTCCTECNCSKGGENLSMENLEVVTKEIQRRMVKYYEADYEYSFKELERLRNR